jgi:hypothetical protein
MNLYALAYLDIQSRSCHCHVRAATPRQAVELHAAKHPLIGVSKFSIYKLAIDAPGEPGHVAVERIEDFRLRDLIPSYGR